MGDGRLDLAQRLACRLEVLPQTVAPGDLGAKDQGVVAGGQRQGRCEPLFADFGPRGVPQGGEIDGRGGAASEAPAEQGDDGVAHRPWGATWTRTSRGGLCAASGAGQRMPRALRPHGAGPA